MIGDSLWTTFWRGVIAHWQHTLGSVGIFLLGVAATLWMLRGSLTYVQGMERERFDRHLRPLEALADSLRSYEPICLDNKVVWRAPPRVMPRTVP